MQSANKDEAEMNNKILKTQNRQQNNATYAKNKRLYTMVDYFKGNIDLSLDEVGGVIIDFLNKMKK